MAFVDQGENVVLGIVYDGPPEAGKTTSVRSLARSFGRDLYTPEEQRGRTVFFDWLEHTGGLFDGAPIRCQIMSVPGQDCFLQRRRHLLGRADAVVFVGDTSRQGWPATLARLRELCGWLGQREGPVTGVVFQANRRDVPDAIPLEVIKEAAASTRVAVIESVALDGSGVKEAFVFAVRLALDRVREEQRLGGLPFIGSDRDARALLDELRTLEQAGPSLALPTPSSPRRASSDSDGERSRASRFDVPSGLVWPPVEGRILLREALARPPSAAAGDSALAPGPPALAPGYRACRAPSALFDDIEEGRKALVGWARLHVSAAAILTRRRCIVLVDDETGAFALWQIVHSEPSLRELFIDGWETMIPRYVARQLVTANRLLSEAESLCREGALPLACTLDSIGISETGAPVYVGDVPLAATSFGVPTAAAQVQNELRALITRRSSADLPELRYELELCRLREAADDRRRELGALIDQLQPT